MPALPNGNDEEVAELLLNNEAPPPNAGIRFPRVASVAGLVGLVASAGLAAYTFYPGHTENASPVETPPLDEAGELEGKDTDAKERKPLLVEGDLAPLLKSLPSNSKPKEGESVDKFASGIFTSVMEKHDLELSPAEEKAYKERFVQNMVASAKMKRSAGSGLIHAAQSALNQEKPVMTEAIAKSVNNAGLAYEAKMQDWMVHVSAKDYEKSYMGRKEFPEWVVQKAEAKAKASEAAEAKEGRTKKKFPTAFDSRTHWPKCKDVIGKIHNQGQCGSCWVFGALGSLDSRLCIKTMNSDPYFTGDLSVLSRGYGASCVLPNGGDGCGGGWEYYVFEYVDNNPGIPTTSCDPYFGTGEGVDHFQSQSTAPSCPTACDPQYPRAMDKDFFKPSGVGTYELILKPKGVLDKLKTAVMTGGPIPFGIYATSTFMGYSGGVFDDCSNPNANHAVVTIGWGDGWLMCMNSWGTTWGLDGFFKIKDCVPTDYTIPGDIQDGLDYPLPIPTEVLETTTTPLPPAPDPSTQVCPYDAATGCITSPNYPENYYNSQTCTFGPDAFKNGIDVKEFWVENTYDYMTVNGKHYTGTHGPQDVVPTTYIVWKSDYSQTTKPGWKICPK